MLEEELKIDLSQDSDIDIESNNSQDDIQEEEKYEEHKIQPPQNINPPNLQNSPILYRPNLNGINPPNPNRVIRRVSNPALHDYVQVRRGPDFGANRNPFFLLQRIAGGAGGLENVEDDDDYMMELPVGANRDIRH